MATGAELEERIRRLEQSVADLQQRLDTPQPDSHWLDKVLGSCEDIPVFNEVMELGRTLRQTDSLPEEKQEGAA